LRPLRLHNLLRIVSEAGRDPVRDAMVKLVTADRREVWVQVESEGDGVVNLPGFDAGPTRSSRSSRGGKEQSSTT
jgi:hypothetical protein